MSQLDVRILMGDSFEYYNLENKFEDKEISKYKQWVYSRFNEVCNKNMNSELNSEWVVRHYLATKMILSATVMLSSLEYCIEKNVRMSIPYLSYYSILTCCRAVIFTLPNISWKNGKDSIMEMNHSKTINSIKDCLMKLNKNYGEEIYNQINSYKDYRELFSYKFPASGTGIMDYDNYSYDKTVDICSTLCEIAQLNSQQIENYIRKNCLHNLDEFKELDMEYLNRCFRYNVNNANIEIIDHEDWYRIDYIRRKQPYPVSIYYTMTEGMVEDFFGTWCSDLEDEEEALYNPDIDWRIIFPVP
ncbi:hypothetical protein PN290_00245 [Romboutsia sp. 1001216sp1]|uniref:hypothetical protein n=1 Tax=unclassified Romboutsia TaxID=2626894 RepID=UPI0018AC01AC|nr:MULTISPECIES: hypothetical protein [unclassified Romboutsia]MDB8794287.1 hypothetical protein [Romboutsia sp. 1001216sp1]MDB8796456.1 hypothetical protein [Romboutsia sp. 1001216sp1]MDB8797791.1 hypothetical protein [Romboutsia sp. 1001216sp1]